MAGKLTRGCRLRHERIEEITNADPKMGHPIKLPQIAGGDLMFLTLPMVAQSQALRSKGRKMA